MVVNNSPKQRAGKTQSARTGQAKRIAMASPGDAAKSRCFSCHSVIWGWLVERAIMDYGSNISAAIAGLALFDRGIANARRLAGREHRHLRTPEIVPSRQLLEQAIWDIETDPAAWLATCRTASENKPDPSKVAKLPVADRATKSSHSISIHPVIWSWLQDRADLDYRGTVSHAITGLILYDRAVSNAKKLLGQSNRHTRTNGIVNYRDTLEAAIREIESSDPGFSAVTWIDLNLRGD